MTALANPTHKAIGQLAFDALDTDQLFMRERLNINSGGKIYNIYIQLSEYNILVFILPLNRHLYFTIIKKISYPNVNTKA